MFAGVESGFRSSDQTWQSKNINHFLGMVFCQGSLHGYFQLSNIFEMQLTHLQHWFTPLDPFRSDVGLMMAVIGT